MRKLIRIVCAIAVAASATLTAQDDVICSGESAAVYVNTTLPTTVDKRLTIYTSAWGDVGESATVAVDGEFLFSTTNQTGTAWTWQPRSKGNHTLTCTFGTNVLRKTLNVAALDFSVQPGPNPPMAKNYSISITPTTRNFGANGGGNSIITSGSGTWSAAVSDPWITLNATSGNVGYPVAYTVSANTNVEQRTGYVYVSGWVHTVTQDGVGGTISPTGATFETSGGSGTISVTAANKMVWQARPNVTWLSVSPMSGAGPGSVTYQVAPYAEVSTRQGTLTVAGNTFTVFQYGRRMALDSYRVTKDYEAHVIPITVNALDITQWSVTPNNTWISVVDAGNGQGGDLVTIAIAENPSYKARTGTVTIGTETFTVTQQGRTALSFNISPTSSTASVNGANGMISVMATPDLPWTATSGANWLTVYATTATGAGNGNVVYNASPNPTLAKRTGKITVTPEAASGMSAKTHTVTQPAAESALSSNGYEFKASGESCSVEVSVASIVQWTIQNTNGWITVNGSTSRTGPGSVVLQAAANNTVYPRSGTVMIAGKTFSVSQKARGVELEYDSKIFDTDGGYESVSIHPDGNVSWTAVASDPTWITIFQGDSGTGDGEILYIVAPYVGDGGARTGWIEVGDKRVYITQRAYELSISPNGSVVKGNNGAGEFGVSANIGVVWTAIVTEPWITLVSGYDAGTGSGTVRFICDDNNTGKPRVGKIVVAGEMYTITQSARILVQIQATAGHGGSLMGSGTYDKGEKIVLTAIPDDGYRFVRWTGPVSSTANPLTMDADELTGIRAEFEPLPVEFTAARSSLDGVNLSWNTLAWATTYRLYRGTSNKISAAATLATLPGGTDTYCDGTGERGVTYWYWVEAAGDEDDVVSGPTNGMKRPIVNSPITYTNLKGATHSNPNTYVEGRALAFTHPSAVVGYVFAGWTPNQITEDMTGAKTVRAEWTANRYSIIYNANGGTGTTSPVDATYDIEVAAADNGFTLEGHSFAGWSTNAASAVVSFVPGQPMTNLTDVADGEFNLYAVWHVNSYTIAFNANGGSGGKTVTQDYGTALSAPTVTREGYTFTGWSPSVPATVPVGNVTYTAQWKVNTYTVTFNANGGTGGKTVTQDYGTALTAPSVSRTGYTFTGWSPSVPSTVPAGNATYTAQWKVRQYTVTFNANGGTGGKTVTQDYGTALAAPTVTREGYTFTGWSPSVPATVPAGNATYTAQWKINQYTVTFDANGGEGGWSRSMDHDASLSAPTITRTGYTFDGWSPAVPAKVPVGGATYTAQWKVNQYTVTFDANGGVGGKTVTQNYGTVLSSPTVTREGYTFNGWSPSVPATIPAGNATYMAQWKANQYMVTFNANGGTGGDDYVTATYGAAMPTPCTAPTLSGYTFVGYWDTVAVDEKGNPKGKQYYDASMKSVRNWDKNSAATLWAKWTNKVTFGKNGGTGGDNYVTCTKGQPMPKRTMPTKSGYVFDGYWTTIGTGGVKYYNADGTSAHTWDKSGSVTLWAKWRKAAVVKVTLGKNGGTGGDDYVTCMEGLPMPTPRTAPTRAGWTFGGYWDTLACDANGNPKGKQYYDANMKSVRNWDKTSAVTLWAKWTVRVKLGKNGGTGGDDYVTVIFNQPFPKRTMPKKSGYAFGGYFVSASSKTGQCYNADGTGTSSMKWSTGGSPTIWALWTTTSSCVELPQSPVAPATTAQSAYAEPAAAAPKVVPAGLYSGVLADGTGAFWLMLDEPKEGCDRTAYLYVASENGELTTECTVEEAGGVLLLATDGGEVYAFDSAEGTLIGI